MNPRLEDTFGSLPAALRDDPALRLAFGFACASRVRHLLENPQVERRLDLLGEHLAGLRPLADVQRAALEAAALATAHPGSASIDGCGHAAVSASYAVAQALAGKAMQAAEYAAYAAVYGQGGYGAVSDPASFELEHAWQCQCLQALADAHARS
jgi:hypothetical protein